MPAKTSATDFFITAVQQGSYQHAKKQSSNNQFLLSSSLKRVVASLRHYFKPAARSHSQIAQTGDEKLTLLRFVCTTQSIRSCHSIPGKYGNVHPARLDTSAATCIKQRTTPSAPSLPAHLQRHGGNSLVSNTRNLIVRTITTPGQPMMLAASAAPKATATSDSRPAPDEMPPPAPGSCALSGSKRADRRITTAAANQVTLLAPLPFPHTSKRIGDDALLDALSDPDAYARHARSLFAHFAKAATIRQLQQNLQLAFQSQRTAWPRSSDMTVLLHLTHVCAGDAERALAALHALRSGDFLMLPAPAAHDSPTSLLSGRSASPAQIDALHVAARLALTQTGFKMLLALLPPSISAQPHGGLQHMLEAVAQIEKEQGHTADLWHHVMRAQLDVASGQASLAQAVLDIESHLIHQAGSHCPDLTAAQKTVLFSWDNGFRQRGEGSDLALTQARLGKLVKYIERASHMQALRNIRFDQHLRFRSTLEVINAKARIAVALFNQSLGRKKSPLTTLASFGVNNAKLMQPEDDLQLLYQHTATVIDLLYSHLQAMLGAQSASTLQAQLETPGEALPALTEHTALLAYWATLAEQQTPLGHRLDAGAVRDIAYQIAKQNNCLGMLPAIENKLAHWIGRELKLSDLQHWVGLYAAAISGQEPLASALRQVGEISNASYVPADLTPTGLQQFMHRFLREHNVGNAVTVTNGSVMGLNMMPLSLSIKKINECLNLALPVSASPSIDARFALGRNAMLNFGSTTHGFEVFIGKQKNTSAALGAAFNISTNPFLGYAGLSTGAGIAGALGYDHVRTRGAMIRAKRCVTADGSSFDSAPARAEIVAFNDLMFAIAKGEHGPLSVEQIWERIAARFFGSRNLSIGWQTQHESTPHLTGMIGMHSRLGVGVGHPYASGGRSLAHTIDLIPSGMLRRKEQGGATHQVRSSNFTRQQQITSHGSVGSGTAVPVHTSGANTESLSVPQLSSTQNFQHSDKGSSAIFRTLMEKGDLSAPFTLRDMDQRDVHAFCALLQKPERYAQYLAIFNSRFGVENGRRKFAEFIEKSKNWAGPGQRYLLRSRIRSEVLCQLNELKTLAEANYQYDPKSMAQQDIADAMMACLQSEASWVPTEVMVLEGQTARDSKGINFGVQWAAHGAVISDRELSYVALPLSVADAWVGGPMQQAEEPPTA